MIVNRGQPTLVALVGPWGTLPTRAFGTQAISLLKTASDQLELPEISVVSGGDGVHTSPASDVAARVRVLGAAPESASMSLDEVRGEQATNATSGFHPSTQNCTAPSRHFSIVERLLA